MDQMSIFDFIEDPNNKLFKIDKPIKLIELFGGIGSQAMALEALGADFIHHRLIEFDKYPVASYNAIHGTSFVPMDITKVHAEDLGIEDDDYCYMMTYSFPCTDLSVAGAMKGMSKQDWLDGKSTRSGLLWEVERILKELHTQGMRKPDVLIMENVPQVHGEKNIDDFNLWLKFLESIGYSNCWQDMDASHYGVAQSRDRCICVSMLGNYSFLFPQEIPLEVTMADYLEDEVPENMYLKTEKAKYLIDKLIVDGKILTDRQTIDLCLKQPRCIDIANCIKAKVDCGISNLQADGSGVCEMSRIHNR